MASHVSPGPAPGSASGISPHFLSQMGWGKVPRPGGTGQEAPPGPALTLGLEGTAACHHPARWGPVGPHLWNITWHGKPPDKNGPKQNSFLLTHIHFIISHHSAFTTHSHHPSPWSPAITLVGHGQRKSHPLQRPKYTAWRSTPRDF